MIIYNILLTIIFSFLNFDICNLLTENYSIRSNELKRIFDNENTIQKKCNASNRTHKK